MILFKRRENSSVILRVYNITKRKFITKEESWFAKPPKEQSDQRKRILLLLSWPAAIMEVPAEPRVKLELGSGWEQDFWDSTCESAGAERGGASATKPPPQGRTGPSSHQAPSVTDRGLHGPAPALLTCPVSHFHEEEPVCIWGPLFPQIRTCHPVAGSPFVSLKSQHRSAL